MFTFNKNSLLMVAACVAVLACVTAASADMIYPLNPSFETPATTHLS